MGAVHGITAGPARRDRVVAALLVRGGQILLCHRSPNRRWFPDVWDLPGGHTDPGETHGRALVRELREELGIIIPEPSGKEFARIVTSDFDLRIWLVDRWVGEISNASPEEHDDMRWFQSHEASALSLAHVRYPALIRMALGAAA